MARPPRVTDVRTFLAQAQQANHDRCALCGGVFVGAPPQTERLPALTDDQLLDVLHAMSAGDHVGFDGEFLCVECTRDVKAARFGQIVERRRARQQGESERGEDE